MVQSQEAQPSKATKGRYSDEIKQRLLRLTVPNAAIHLNISF